MEFSDLINDYISRIGCTAKELAEASGLSAAIISRYRSGERLPQRNRTNLEKLAHGIRELATKKGKFDIAYEDILGRLSSAASNVPINYENFSEKLSRIITVLDINIADLARSLNFDASYLSKIRVGKRRPADVLSFIDGVCNYIIENYTEHCETEKIADLLGCSKAHFEEKFSYYIALQSWFSCD